jgi:hypothetical protein
MPTFFCSTTHSIKQEQVQHTSVLECRICVDGRRRYFSITEKCWVRANIFATSAPSLDVALTLTMGGHKTSSAWSL